MTRSFPLLLCGSCTFCEGGTPFEPQCWVLVERVCTVLQLTCMQYVQLQSVLKGMPDHRSVCIVNIDWLITLRYICEIVLCIHICVKSKCRKHEFRMPICPMIEASSKSLLIAMSLAYAWAPITTKCTAYCGMAKAPR